MSVDSLLTFARSQIGYVEKPVNKTKYGVQFGADGVFWCMQFVWACFENSGNDGKVLKTASTRVLRSAAADGKLDMQLLPKDAAARPGDVVLFDMGGPKPVNHVGIVEAVLADGRLRCIEGNTGGKGPGGERNGGMVARKLRNRGKVVNFVRTALPAAAAAQPGRPAFPGQVIKRPADGRDVKRIQARINAIYKGKVPSRNGQPLQVVGHFGPRTHDAVVDFQTLHQLKPDGEVGKDTWAKLFG